jgi:hypothetical protein
LTPALVHDSDDEDVLEMGSTSKTPTLDDMDIEG